MMKLDILLEKIALSAVNTKIHCFAGPTISIDEILSVGKFHCHGPAEAMSFVDLMLTNDVTAIVLIDGIFGHRPSIWHKEILWCLSKGVRVLGCSSMGALRASELNVYGMEGVGSIYQRYHKGAALKHPFSERDDPAFSAICTQLPKIMQSNIDLIDWLYNVSVQTCLLDDDDVALVHGPKEVRYQPATVPLVDIYATINRCNFTDVQKAFLSCCAKLLHYTKRTNSNIVSMAEEHDYQCVGLSCENLNQLKTEAFSQKKKDALATLQKAMSNVDLGNQFEAQCNLLVNTKYWRREYSNRRKRLKFNRSI